MGLKSEIFLSLTVVVEDFPVWISFRGFVGFGQVHTVNIVVDREQGLGVKFEDVEAGILVYARCYSTNFEDKTDGLLLQHRSLDRKVFHMVVTIHGPPDGLLVSVKGCMESLTKHTHASISWVGILPIV